MKQIFKAALVAAIFLTASAWAVSPAAAGMPVVSKDKSPLVNQLDVEIKDHVEAIMSWTEFPGSGLYYVGVYDLTNDVRFVTFTTLRRKGIRVEGLTEGHTYRFTVRRGTTIVTVDVTA